MIALVNLILSSSPKRSDYDIAEEYLPKTVSGFGTGVQFMLYTIIKEKVNMDNTVVSIANLLKQFPGEDFFKQH